MVLLRNYYTNQDILMDRFSFLNAAHTEFFADLYEQYLQNPDSVEPSWRAFFQGFDFGMTTFNEENAVQELANYAANVPQNGQLSDKVQKEFNVLKLIDGYRTRGHLFTETNPVRERRTFSPTLELENFDLSSADLNTVFDAAKILGHKPSTLQEILDIADASNKEVVTYISMGFGNPYGDPWNVEIVGEWT